MKDIADRVDAAKAALAHNVPLTHAAAVELGMIGLDFLGELIANSRRIAVALETIAANTAEKVEGKMEVEPKAGTPPPPNFRALSPR